jgi:hypothetical protein
MPAATYSDGLGLRSVTRVDGEAISEEYGHVGRAG